jgi:hypothetical protein
VKTMIPTPNVEQRTYRVSPQYPVDLADWLGYNANKSVVPMLRWGQ